MRLLSRYGLGVVLLATLGMACSAGAPSAATPPTSATTSPASTSASTSTAAVTSTSGALRPGSAAQAPAAATSLIIGAAEPKPFAGLGGSISAMSFSPDGKVLAAGGQDAFVQLWDVASGQALKKLTSANDPTRAFNLRTLAFSPDGKRIAKDGPPLVVWDVASGQAVFEKFVLNSEGSGGGASALAFSPNGQILAAGDGRSLQLLDAATGEPRKVLVDSTAARVEPATAATRGLAFSADGKTLASAGPANAVTLWDVGTGTKTTALTGPATQINSVSFSPDGKYVAGGGAQDITVWELPAGTPRTLVHNGGEHSVVNSVAFSLDGAFLAGTSMLGLDLWNVATWQPIPIATALNQGVLDAFAFSPDAQFLAGVRTGDDKVVRVWPLAPGPVKAGTAALTKPAAASGSASGGQPAPATGRPTSANPAAEPGEFDVCTLVTQAEAQAMLGAPVITSESRPMACRYAAADGSSVGVDSAGGASAEYSKLMFGMSHDGAPGVKDIPGLGDKAFSSGAGEFCCALYVLKGSTLFEITVTPVDRAFQNGAPTDKLLILARAAASRL